MIAVCRKERFYTLVEAKAWLKTNGYSPVKRMKHHYINHNYSAKIEYMPASKTFVVLIGLSDRG